MADFDSDTDDSDAEGNLCNVTRQVMRPPGCSGKAKRGHLCFDASFETGNLGRIDFIAEYDYDLFIRPDTCNPRFRLWFNFTVDNAKADQRAIFNLVNIHKDRNLFCEGLTPLVRSTSRPKWTRMPGENVYYYRSPLHRDQYILSFAMCFDVEQDVYQFALTYPYSYSRMQTLLDLHQKRNLDFYWRHTLAFSLLKRTCDIIFITDRENYEGPVEAMAEARSTEVIESTKVAAPTNLSLPPPLHHHRSTGGRTRRVVVVMARVHGGESPTSYMVQGMLELLTGNSTVATTLREHIVFIIIPMIDPDGAFLGNYRCSLMGMDLNRVWGEANSWGHPTVHAAKNLLLGLNDAQWSELDLVLDLHAHSSLLGTFIYGNSYDDVYRHERHIVFPKMMSYACDDYCHDNTIYNKDPSKSQSARRWLCSNLRDSTNVYSIHTSIYGYRPGGRGPVIPYTEEAYIRTGKNIVRAVLDYYQFLGLVPHYLPDALPLHDLPRRRPPTPPPQSRQLKPLPGSSQVRTPTKTTKGKWGSSDRRGAQPSMEPPEVRETAGSEGAHTDTVASASSDDASSVSSGDESDGFSDTSGLMVRIKQKAASADEDDANYTRRYGQERPDRNIRLPSQPHDPTSRILGGPDRRRAGRRMRHPRTTFVTLFPGQENNEPPRSDDDTRSMPDLPSLRSSLPALRTSPGRKQRSVLPLVAGPGRPSTLVWQDLQQQQPLPPRDIKLSYRYYDFRRLTRPRKRRHKRKAKNRSSSRSRPARHARASRHPPAPPAQTLPSTSSPERPRPRRVVAGGGFNVTRMATPPRETGVRLPPPRGVRMIDVNQLTIGGYRDHVTIPRWQASPRRHPLQTPLQAHHHHHHHTHQHNVHNHYSHPHHHHHYHHPHYHQQQPPSSPPLLLRRFLDPRAPLY